MITSHDEQEYVLLPSELESPLLNLEQQLSALGHALGHRDATAVDRAAAGLHEALARAVVDFSRAARSGGVPPALRHRLAQASGQVAAQRDAFARATASLDRAIDVLIPGLTSATPHSEAGPAERAAGQGGCRLA